MTRKALEEYGVWDATASRQLYRVGGGEPPTGAYVFDGDCYTFSSEDAGHVMFLLGPPPREMPRCSYGRLDEGRRLP